MQVRKIGNWREEKVASGPDSGFYLEAVALPRDQGRYAKVSFAMIEDVDLWRLEQGGTIEFPLAASDLAARIDDL